MFLVTETFSFALRALVSRFGDSHGSKSQPWLSPKRLISLDHNPSWRCPDGNAVTALTLWKFDKIEKRGRS